MIDNIKELALFPDIQVGDKVQVQCPSVPYIGTYIATVTKVTPQTFHVAPKGGGLYRLRAWRKNGKLISREGQAVPLVPATGQTSESDYDALKIQFDNLSQRFEALQRQVNSIPSWVRKHYVRTEDLDK